MRRLSLRQVVELVGDGRVNPPLCGICRGCPLFCADWHMPFEEFLSRHSRIYSAEPHCGRNENAHREGRGGVHGKGIGSRNYSFAPKRCLCLVAEESIPRDHFVRSRVPARDPPEREGCRNSADFSSFRFQTEKNALQVEMNDEDTR